MQINYETKIILDVDTGIDDAMAIILLYACYPNNIIGITTCGGNVELSQTTKNTLSILSLLNSNIPVYIGSETPLSGNSYTYCQYFHGNNGIADIKLPTNKVSEKLSAEKFIIESAHKYKEKLIIVALAPLTNIAKAINLDKTIVNDIEKIFIMGGAITVAGNETTTAETNFYQDPEAAQIVIENLKNISLIPLDVTNKCAITKSEINTFNANNEIVKFVVKAINNWYGFFGDKKNREFELYDPLAIAPLIGGFLKFKQANVDIDTHNNLGSVVAGKNNIQYAYDVDASEFKKMFISKINSII